MFQAALDGLEPRPAGRPPRQPPDPNGRLAALEAMVRELRLDLQAAQVREEIALCLPRVVRRAEPAKKAARTSRMRPTPS
jgi:hypothetical protein